MINIFVAKLDFGVTSDQLRQEFERFGKVTKATVAFNRETGNSRGFAFVEMAVREEGQEAIQSLDGKVFNGRACAVKEADPKPENRSFVNKENKPVQFNSKKEDLTKTEVAEDNSESISLEELPNVESRRKTKDKKSKIDWENEGFQKKSKIISLKPKTRFSEFDDDDDDDLNLLKLRRELEQDDFLDNEED